MLGDGEGVVHLDTETAHRALDLGVSQEDLRGPQVTRLALDQRRLGPLHRVRAVSERVQPDLGETTMHEPRTAPLSRQACGLVSYAAISV